MARTWAPHLLCVRYSGDERPASTHGNPQLSRGIPRACRGPVRFVSGSEWDLKPKLSRNHQKKKLVYDFLLTCLFSRGYVDRMVSWVH
jgi:hypothetical protein